MNSVQIIPTEILQKIFKNIPVHDKKDLIQLQLTCKNWSVIARSLFYESIARSLFYESIALENPLRATYINIERPKERERSLLKTLDAPGSPIRFLVKSLSLNVPDNPSQSSGSCHLSELVCLCPNLISLWFPNVSITFYKKIKELYNEGHLQQLKCITMSIFDSMDFLVMESYNDAMLDFTETITELVIANMVGGFLEFISNFPLSQASQDFPRLETLHIIANSNVFLYELDVLFEIIEVQGIQYFLSFQSQLS